MIANVTKGRSVYGLINYLVGPGRWNEHTQPMVVAGSRELASMYDIDPTVGWSSLDVWSLATQLDQHRREQSELDLADDRSDKKAARGTQRPRHVYHVSLSLRADEGKLGDDRWATIVTDYVRGMGFSGCEWVAVHHGQSTAGNDHVHLVVNLVRADGKWASTREDFRRSMRVSRELERKHGLRPLRDSDQDRGLPGFKPAEQHQRVRTATADGAERVTYIRTEPQRVTLERLVRMAASSAASEHEFVRNLWRLGAVTSVRYADGGRSQITGYAVALKDVLEGTRQIWQSGSKLAPDLSLPELRKRWSADDASGTTAWGVDPAGMTSEPWTNRSGQRWDSAVVDQLRRAQHGWRNLSDGDGDRDRWRDAASDTAGLLGAAAYGLGDDRLAAAERQMASIAQPGFGGGHSRSPDPAIGQAIRLLCVAGSANDVAGWLAVLKQLQRLAESIADASHARGEMIRATRIRDSMNQYVQGLAEDLAVAGVVGHADHNEALAAARAAGIFAGPDSVRPSSGNDRTPPDRPGREQRRDHGRER